MPDLNALPLPEVYVVLAAGGGPRRLLELAREEDLGVRGDITGQACIPEGAKGAATVVSREDGVLSGLAAVPDLLAVFGSRLEFEPTAEDGDPIGPGTAVARLSGWIRDLVAVERTLLNLLGRLSGIATRTGHFVAAASVGARARVYDTRKTTPGLRALEKYAVRCGGGRSHRLGLHDAVLIKDNHLASVPPERLREWLTGVCSRARSDRPSFVEVEVDTLEQLEAVLALEPGLVDFVLLDNMPLGMIGRAVDLRRDVRPSIELEVSGGVTLENIGAIARTGVERISVGSLTHGARSLDLGLDAT
ncbi:MAG: carboxylating nicotinate-nucleotide diphosphorylase [Phycisphaerales bacterium]|nr:carboxylating nicotinate-nucleotide diphosphorylase [Phycisphaerales bacterium]